MAKIYGLFGSMTGKLADTVMSVRNGEQIARKYQPVVYNPSTPAQIANRAKLKLMSQLSAVMAPVIAIPRQGSVSSRNLFVKQNFHAATYASDQADIALDNIKLTKSVVALPSLVFSNEGTVNSVALASNVANAFDRIVYILFLKQADNTLRLRETHVQNVAGEDGTFPQVLDAGGALTGVIYAYGVRLNSENARSVFGDMETVPAETVAKLIVSNTLLESDITLSETVSLLLPVS